MHPVNRVQPAWIFHELRSLKIHERGHFTLVVYVERPMTLPGEQALAIQRYRLAQQVTFDKKKSCPAGINQYSATYRDKIKNIIGKQSHKQLNRNHSCNIQASLKSTNMINN
jgi:hypothetical protein